MRKIAALGLCTTMWTSLAGAQNSGLPGIVLPPNTIMGNGLPVTGFVNAIPFGSIPLSGFLNSVPTQPIGTANNTAASTAYAAAVSGLSAYLLYAINYAGATAGDKISACVAALPSTGGICDARGLPSGGTIPTITIAQSGVTILGPCGSLTVTGTINVYNVGGVRGVTWKGCGATFNAVGTQFAWGGNSTDPMFRLRGVAYSEFSDFYINSNQFVPLAEGIRSETITGPITTSNRYRNITINGTASGGLGKGFRWCTGDDCGGAGPDNNNDINYLENVIVTNYVNCAYSIEGTQVQNLLFVNSQMIGSSTGARGVCTTQAANSNRNSGSFSWYGGGGGGNTVADFDLGAPNNAITIQAGTWEGSNRWLQTGPNPGGSPWPISLIGNRWSANNLSADNNVIFYQQRGPLVVEANTIDGPQTGASPKITISTSGSPAKGVAIGNRVNWDAATVTSQPFVAAGGQALVSWEVLGNLVQDNSANLFPIPNIIQPDPRTVANLPTCAAGSKGFRQFVTDQNTAISYRGAVTGGGSTNQAVVCDGTNWLQD